jgi:hypothetical protein
MALLKMRFELGKAAHASNPSYLGRDEEDQAQGQLRQKVIKTPSQQNKLDMVP